MARLWTITFDWDGDSIHGRSYAARDGLRGLGRERRSYTLSDRPRYRGLDGLTWELGHMAHTFGYDLSSISEGRALVRANYVHNLDGTITDDDRSIPFDPWKAEGLPWVEPGENSESGPRL